MTSIPRPHYVNPTVESPSIASNSYTNPMRTYNSKASLGDVDAVLPDDDDEAPVPFPATIQRRDSDEDSAINDQEYQESIERAEIVDRYNSAVSHCVLFLCHIQHISTGT